jgi:hypothetical protein
VRTAERGVGALPDQPAAPLRALRAPREPSDRWAGGMPE